MAEEHGLQTTGNSEVVTSVPYSDTSSHNRLSDPTSNGMEQLQEWHETYNVQKNIFLEQIGSLASQTSVVAVHRIPHSSWFGKFRYQSHQILIRAVSTKFRGNANYTWGWYGASKDDISAIVSHGFTRPDAPVYGRFRGLGIHLSPQNCLLHEIIHAAPDEEGIRHILTCHVIMGKPEVISHGSGQFKPSSDEFDTGVDNLVAPKVYIVWSACMNSYLKPDMVISFKSPPSQNNSRGRLSSMPTMRQRISYANLLAILKRLLEPSKYRLISEQYDLVEQKHMPISVMIHVMREIAGDELIDILGKYNRNM